MAVQWQVGHSARQALWRDFPKELSEQTEEKYVIYRRDGLVPGIERGVSYRWQNRDGEWVEYEICFDAMEQTNLRTGMRRPLRRIDLG